MSLRFSLYAVDLARFGELLNRPLADILREYSDKGKQDEPGFYFREEGREDGNRYYHARPGRVFVQDLTRSAGDKGFLRDLRDEDLRDIPYLRRSLHDHLRVANSACLSTLFNAFSEWSGTPIVRLLLRRYKWGPPEALARMAFRVFGKDHLRLTRLISLFQKVYRRFADHEPFTGRIYELHEFDFPVKPNEDGDFLLSVWSQEEAEFLVETLELLQKEEASRSRSFYQETIPPGVCDEDYFRDMIKGLLILKDVRFEQLKVAGFVTH
jgi:hypothetical protein